MLVRNFTFKVSSQFLAAVMAFVSLLVMSRYVAHEYGVMMWGLALITLINTLADLGFNSANLKFISTEGFDRSACFTTYMAIKAVLTAVMIACTVVTVYGMKMAGGIDDEKLGVCLVFVLYQIISNVQFAIYYTLDGMRMSGKSSLLTLAECGIRNTLLIALALMYVDASTLSSAYVVATSVSVIMSVYMAHQVGLRITKPLYIHDYVKFALPLAAALILTSVVTNLDKVMVGLFYPSIEVTYYSTAVGLVATFTAVGVSLNNVLLPHLSSSISKNNERTEHTLWGLERGLAIILLPFIAFFLVFGTGVSTVLFGGTFGRSGEILSILSIQIVPFVFAGIMAQVLYALNKGLAYLRASSILCVVAVAGFVVLIPDNGFLPFCMGYGGIGAAISVSLAYIVYAAVLILMVHNTTRYRLYPKLWKIGIAFVIALGCMLAIDHVATVTGLLRLLIVGIICEAVFVGTLYAMKEVTKGDIAAVLKKFINDEDRRGRSARQSLWRFSPPALSSR